MSKLSKEAEKYLKQFGVPRIDVEPTDEAKEALERILGKPYDKITLGEINRVLGGAYDNFFLAQIPTVLEIYQDLKRQVFGS